MDERDEQRRAAEALATISAHQDRTRRAARLPVWVYVAMFVLVAGGAAANDFVDLTGAELLAGLILATLVIVVVTGFATGSAPLSRVRGVQPRQTFDPRVFGAVVIIGGVGAWLVARYGTAVTHAVASAVGLRDYPNTVAGVIYGAAFTALYALVRLMGATTQRRGSR